MPRNVGDPNNTSGWGGTASSAKPWMREINWQGNSGGGWTNKSLVIPTTDTYMVTLSGTAFMTAAGGLGAFQLYVDYTGGQSPVKTDVNGAVVQCVRFFNEANTHKTMPTASFRIALTAGTHNFVLGNTALFTNDQNDVASMLLQAMS
jgi:hypothetical protein